MPLTTPNPTITIVKKRKIVAKKLNLKVRKINKNTLKNTEMDFLIPEKYFKNIKNAIPAKTL